MILICFVYCNWFRDLSNSFSYLAILTIPSVIIFLLTCVSLTYLCIGKPVVSEKGGIWDNYRVKKQFLHLASLISIKLLLVDEVMRAGRKMGGK